MSPVVFHGCVYPETWFPVRSTECSSSLQFVAAVDVDRQMVVVEVERNRQARRPLRPRPAR